MSYSVDFRKRTIQYYNEGHTYREAVKTFNISESTLTTWINKCRKRESLERKYPNYKIKIDLHLLEDYVRENPDAY